MLLEFSPQAAAQLAAALNLPKDTGAQHVRIERLRQVIVGARREAFHLLLRIGAGSKHDDGDVVGGPVGPQLSHHVGAAHLGHHLVGENAIRLFIGRPDGPFATVGCLEDPERGSEHRAHVGTEVGVVVHHQHCGLVVLGRVGGIVVGGGPRGGCLRDRRNGSGRGRGLVLRIGRDRRLGGAVLSGQMRCAAGQPHGKRSALAGRAVD
jgi:hypothetical protein